MLKWIGLLFTTAGALLAIFGVSPFWFRLGIGLALMGVGLIGIEVGREYWMAYQKRRWHNREIGEPRA